MFALLLLLFCVAFFCHFLLLFDAVAVVYGVAFVAAVSYSFAAVFAALLLLVRVLSG